MQGGGASCPPPEEILGKMGLWEEIEKGRKRNNSGWCRPLFERGFPWKRSSIVAFILTQSNDLIKKLKFPVFPLIFPCFPKYFPHSFYGLPACTSHLHCPYWLSIYYHFFPAFSLNLYKLSNSLKFPCKEFIVIFPSFPCTVRTQLSSSTQVYPVKIWCILLYFPCLFGKRIVFHAKQMYKQQTLSETKLLWDNNTNQQKLYVVA